MTRCFKSRFAHLWANLDAIRFTIVSSNVRSKIEINGFLEDYATQLSFLNNVRNEICTK